MREEDFERAFDLYQNALDLYKEMENEREQVDILYNLAQIQYEWGEIDLAISALKTAIEIATRTNYSYLDEMNSYLRKLQGESH